MRNLTHLWWIVWRGAAVATLFVFLIYCIVELSSHKYITTGEDIQRNDSYTAIVLGAALQTNGAMSPVFRDRVDTAITLYQMRKVQTILVSGDNGRVEHNEVNPARLYLLEQGISDNDIFLDHAGFDTYSTMYRARDIFLVENAIIVTQSFYLPRAVFIARRLGINAYGVVADKREYYLQNSIREVFADTKAVLNLLYHRNPKYLGEKIPISGDSSQS